MKILTFDIEEWFHLLDNESTKTEESWAAYPSRIHQNMERIFKMLDERKQSATFFCLGWIAKKYPEIIRAINERGYEIGTHSNLHQLAYEQSREIFKADLEQSINTLESITGKKIKAYRAPGFSIKKDNSWAFEVLCQNGIETDCSVFPASRAHGGFSAFGHAEPCIIDIKGMRLKEFPINTFNALGKSLIFSGGGYFRVLPKFIIKGLVKQSDYVMTYFHPRDFDAGQPKIEGLGIIRRFKSYYGIEGAIKKLDDLIGEFEFIDLATAEKNIDWTSAKVIKI